MCECGVFSLVQFGGLLDSCTICWRHVQLKNYLTFCKAFPILYILSKFSKVSHNLVDSFEVRWGFLTITGSLLKVLQVEVDLVGWLQSAHCHASKSSIALQQIQIVDTNTNTKFSWLYKRRTNTSQNYKYHSCLQLNAIRIALQ